MQGFGPAGERPVGTVTFACVAAGRGLTKATWYFAGGSTRDVSYTLATP